MNTYTYPKNDALLQKAAKVIPCGVYGHQGPAEGCFIPISAFPKFAAKAKGSYFYDVDGNKFSYSDFEGESRNPVLRIIDKPTRFEFLTSIALKQNFEGLTVCPNYHVDDEGLPTFTASGGLADIECFDTDCNPLVEVTLITARTQATMEMPAITRHLQEAVTKYPDKIVFSILVAPAIHADTKYMAGYSKYQYDVDILTFTTEEFIQNISTVTKIRQLANN